MAVAWKVAVVTGGASGIGEVTCRRIVALGGAVIVGDIQEERGTALAKELGANARFLRVDVTSEDDIAWAVDSAVEWQGRLDCMFNNAGIVGAIGPIDQTPMAEYDFSTAILLRGVFCGMKHAARVMKPRRSGVILSTSSIAGVLGGLGPHVYAASKAAIIGLTRNVAAELGRYGIRVNAIVPGNMATPMVADVAAGDPAAMNEAIRTVTSLSPLRDRPGLADDIAAAATWLMSDDAGFVSGHALVVDGGLTSGSPAAESTDGGLYADYQPLIREAGGRGMPVST